MPTHRVAKKTVHPSPRGAKKLGTCSVCGPETEVVQTGMGWKCLVGERQKAVEARLRAKVRKDAREARDKAKKLISAPRDGIRTQQTAARVRAKIDRIAGKVVRSAGRCEAEGQVLANGKVYQCSARMECAHVLSRGHHRIRHHPRNLTCLCNIHHRYYTQHPNEWEKFIGEERFDWLYKLRNDPDAEGQEYWLRYWQAELEKIEVSE